MFSLHVLADRGSWFLVLVVATLVLAGFTHRSDADQSIPEGPGDEPVVALVTGQPITAARFNATYVRYLIQTGRNDTRENRWIHLNNLIDAYLLAGEAQRRGVVDEAYYAFSERMMKEAVGAAYFDTAFLDSVPALTDAEVREAYRRGKTQVVLRHLFYRDAAQARVAYERLKKGEDFLKLANESFRTAAFDSLAGFLGPAGYWDLDDAVAEAAYALKPGAFSEPVRSRYGWHILRVEHALTNPLLIEEDYQLRRSGVAGKARQRRVRLEGDRFVRSFMEGIDVQVDATGVGALQSAVRKAVADNAGGRETPQPLLSDAEVQQIRSGLQPETVLASYQLDGRRYEFRAVDYFRWIESLPGSEVRGQTAASVGRALRNEALAMQGFARHLDTTATVRAEVGHLSNLYLASRLRAHVRENNPVKPTEAQLRDAYEAMGFRKLKKAVADYWTVPFRTMAEAEAARTAVAAGRQSPEKLAGYEAHRNRSLDEVPELMDHIRKTPPAQTRVVGTAKGNWYLLHVDRRDLVYTSFEEARPKVEALVGTHLAETELLRDLWSRSEVKVDTLLFEQLMRRR